MILKEYLGRLQEEGLIRSYELEGRQDENIDSITYDSREVRKGTMFVCKGAAFREEYLAEARRRGAVCYVAEKPMEAGAGMPYLTVKNIRKAQPVLGAFFYGNPQKKLTLTGITGTKGKTTTAYYLKAILDEWEKTKPGAKTECGLLSTIRTWDGKEDKPSSMTTPEALELYRHFRNAADCGMQHMIMEVSSQALKYQRVRGLEYEVGIFLNISEDHISPLEHEDFEDYFSSKLSMFRQVKTACVNVNSRYSERILSAARITGRVITFGTKGKPDIYGSMLKKEKGGIFFHVKTPDYERDIRLGMSGIFNVENALAAIAAAYAYGVPADIIVHALASVRVNGRMEQYVSCDGKITAIVDFAHNQLSFEKLYDSVLQEFPGYGIFTVFGCPGGKAKNRRRELGLISGLFSKKVFLTADDPGMEKAEDIAAEIGEYMELLDCPYTYIENRGKAIRTAVVHAAAQKGKHYVLLVLGKGHETHQKYGNRVYDYPSDAVLVKEALRDYDARVSQSAKKRRVFDETPRRIYNLV